MVHGSCIVHLFNMCELNYTIPACKKKRKLKIEIVWTNQHAMPLNKHENLVPDCLTYSFSQCILSMACRAYWAEYPGVCISGLSQNLVTPKF